MLVLASAAIPDPFFRALAVIFVFTATVFIASTREEPEVENPLFQQLHDAKPGLDRRKYGHLRAATERLLDQVREMNRIAVEGREGKLSQRHAHAELDRLAAKMRDLVDDIRKSAGIPTPAEATVKSDRAVKPQVVIPKARESSDDSVPPSSTTAAAERDATDEELDELVAKAEAEARARAAAAGEGSDPRTKGDSEGREETS